MAIDFPASPVDNQSFTPAGGATFIFSGSAWHMQPGWVDLGEGGPFSNVADVRIPLPQISSGVYRRWKVMVDNVCGVSIADAIYIQFSVDNMASWITGYNYGGNVGKTNDNSAGLTQYGVGTGQTTNQINITGYAQQEAQPAYPGTWELDIYNSPSQPAFMWRCHTFVKDTGGGFSQGVGYSNTGGLTTHFRVFTAGNISMRRWKLAGLVS